MRSTSSRWLVVCALVLGVPGIAAAQDLVSTISSITVTSTQVTYNLQVCNQGGANTTSQLALYYDLSAAPDCGTTANATWNVVNLSAGECRSFVHNRSSVPLGNYTAWSRADATCTVSESNETNNNSSKDYAVLPELYVVSLTASVTISTVTYTVTVRNSGATTTAPFTIGLYYNLPSAPACASTADQSFLVSSGLAHNTTATYQYVRSSTPPGAYQAWALVDSGCAIEEAIESNNALSRSYSVGPDIYLATPTVSVSGSTVTYSVYVCNLGTVDTGPFSLALWYNRATAPTCGATGADHTFNLANLPLWSGDPLVSCTTLTHVRQNAPAGSYTAWFFGDPTCTLAELDETNNLRERAYQVLAPDYTITGFTAAVAGTQVTYSATVCNQGAGSGIPFLAGLYFDRSTAPDCATAADFTWPVVNGLAAGACTTLTHQRSGVASGNYNAWTLADRACAVPESSESNNAASTAYAIAPTQPDLSIASFTAVVSGTSVTYTAQVCNGGTTTTSAIVIGFYYHLAAAPGCATTPSATSTIVGGIVAGACVLSTHVQTGGAAGTYTGWVMADRTCTITEYSETNNSSSSVYAIAAAQQPDLWVESLDVAVVNTAVTYVAKVCNKGTAASPAGTAGIYYHRSQTPSAGCLDAPDGNHALTPLAVGACQTVSWSLQNVPPGSYTAWAMADSPCAVTESDENNNATSKGYVVVIVQPDLGAPDLQPPDAGVAKDSATPVDSTPPKLDGAAPKIDGAAPKIDGTAPKIDASSVDSVPPKIDSAVVDGKPPAGEGGTADAPIASDAGAGDGKRGERGISAEGSQPPAESGCSCRVGGRTSSELAWPFLALLLVVLGRRRRD